MPLIQPLLLSNLLSHVDNLNEVNSKSNTLRNLEFLNKFSSYASTVFPTSSMAEMAKLTALSAFTGDINSVPKSYSIALATALGAYTPVLAAGMAPMMFLPSLIPMTPAILPGLMKLKSVEDKISQLQILATNIDVWMHTGISMLTIPPAPPVPTPWI